jgi:DNA-binding SARP family transcriptional activator
VDFRVLGPLEVVDRGRALAVGGPRQRAVLAFLLLHANEVVSAERLVAAAWGEEPPASGSAGLHVRISQLRKVLGATRIRTRAPGYALSVDPGELDVERFEHAASEGRRALAAGDPEHAERALGDALRLWRGPPLADVAVERSALGELARLEELRWTAMESRIEARLELGRHGELVGELEALVREQPLRERLHEHRMLALYRSGRQAEALAAYREARKMWVEELAIEPGRRLQRLEHAILVQDASLDLPMAGVGDPTGGRAREERKLATVLLADVVADDDLERTRAWLRRLRELAEVEVEAAGGTIDTLSGGGILATFGAPAAQEDHAARGLRSARSLAQQLGRAFPFRIAVETGEIIVGKSGLSGPPLSVAMRLLSGGNRGEVRVGDRAVAAARLAGARRGAPTSPFVGRTAELDAVRAEYRRACDGDAPRLVTIVGDAGVGKSRLASELMAGLAAESPAPRCVAGRCLSYGRGVTYRALGDVLRDLLGLHENDSRATILDRLGAREILALTLGLDVAGDTHPLAAVDGLRRAWLDLLSELVAERPAVVVIEDLHWAQDDLLDLLEYVLDALGGPLLLVGTARPELVAARPSWGRRRDAATIWLEPLSRGDAARLVADAPAQARDVLLERAEGNPFFIEELIAGLADEVDLDVSAVPDSVQAVLAARIDQLPPLEKEALQAAAVIGRAFWREPVRELLGGAMPNFAMLEERDFIRPRTRSSFDGVRELSFKHALTREVAYYTLPRGTRARLHAGFARWLEGFGGGREEHAAVLAHHYAEAVRPENTDLVWADDPAELGRLRETALVWLRRAAQLAVRRYEIDDSVALLRRALELEHGEDARCRLWRAIGRANALKFDGEAFWTAMETALELAQDDPTRAEICSELAVEAFVRAGMWTRTPALDRVGEWIARALELAEPDTPSRARALVAKAFRELDDGDAAAEAADIAERLDDPELCVYAWDARGAVAMAAADYEAAWRWRTRRLELLPRVTDPDLRTIIAETPFSACIATCRFNQARKIARLHDELTRPLTPHHRLHGAAILVEVEELLGDWRSIRDLEERVQASVAANAGTPCLRNARSLLVCALAAACLGDAAASRELERAADDLGLRDTPVLDAPRLRLALIRDDRERASDALARIEAQQGWYSRGHGTSLATLVARLDALSTLGYRAEVEREAVRLVSPSTFVAPFALRALGVVRGDQELVTRAVARFEELGLEWYAAQSAALSRP